MKEQFQLTGEELLALLSSGMFLYRLMDKITEQDAQDSQTRAHMTKLYNASETVIRILNLSDIQVQYCWQQAEDMVTGFLPFAEREPK